MPYVYEEGAVPVPAGRCTRCGGLLEAATATSTIGFFEPSTLDEGTWVFVTGKDLPDDAKPDYLRCRACDVAFAVNRGTPTLKHPAV